MSPTHNYANYQIYYPTADYYTVDTNSIHAEINDKITSTGRHQITGSILKDILLKIVACIERIKIYWTKTYNPNGILTYENVYIGGYPIEYTHKLYVCGHIFSYDDNSDLRLKKDIEPLKKVLPKLQKLNAVRFKWNQEIRQNPEIDYSIGMVAQEVAKEFPEIVKQFDHEGYLSINYNKFAAVLLEGVKELKAENDALKKRIVKLEDKAN